MSTTPPPGPISTSSSLVVQEAKPITRDEANAIVTSFFTPDRVAVAMRKSNWTVDREIAILQSIAEDPDVGARMRIQACDALRQRALDSMRLTGKLAEMTATSTSHIDGKDMDAVDVVKTLRGSMLLLQSAAPNVTIDLEGDDDDADQ